MLTLENLAGKVAVITGASSGIGVAAARVLAAEGMRVVLVARRGDRIRALAEEIGAAALAVEADVADASQVNRLFDQVRSQHGAVDLLLNNAGMGINGPFADSKPADWKTQIDVNLYGVLNCTHAVLPLMRERNGAMVCTIASVGGRYGIEGWSVYNATKFAVVGFHDALRKELGPQGIRFSVIEPGAVWTEWGHNVAHDAMKKRREGVDALMSDDVAHAVAYAFAQPARVLIEEMLIRPTKQITP